MDHFFWRYDAECKIHGIVVEWFFPNTAVHGEYEKLTIIPAGEKSIERSFISYFQAKNDRFSHIITHFLELCTPFFKKIKQKTGAAIIAVDHNPRPLGGYSFKKKVKKRLKGAIYSQYIDVFVGVSAYTVRELLRDFGSHIESKCRVIHNGIVTEDIAERTSSNQPPHFIVVSHLRKSKGIQDLIEAVHLLPVSIKKDLKIDVYGEGPYEAILMQLARNKEVVENFVFKGSSSHISTVFCQYDYLLHPTHMECFSLTLLESLAANVPVITTPVGGNLEIVKDGANGFIVPVERPQQLADCMTRIFEGQKKITVNTRAKIESEFGIIQMIEKHLALLHANY
ncbi:MAG TPA: glycosyltransferase [Leeuwenhoekiella sp.]|nr:glycosyltransferase [Leeuwenhoekiella sp.]